MTFNAPSFFVGVGTVLGLLVVGFGSGVLMSSVFLDKGAREPNRIERRAADVVKPPVIEATPVPAVSVPQLTPPAPQVVEPAPPSPAPQIQQATSQGEPQPKPQVRRVIIPPEPQTQAQPQPQQQPQIQQTNSPPATLPRPALQIQQATSQPEPPPGAAPPPAVRRVPLGAEQPVALTNPAPERTDTQREVRKKAREAKREKKKLERQLAEQRRQQRIKQAEELQAARRPRQVEVDDDDREERPSFFRRERGGPFGRPFFRQYGDDDD